MSVACGSSFISIHAAREGGDGFGFCPCRRAERFQSTPPVKAATRVDMQLLAGCTRISIHAAREGGDENIPQRLPVLGISIHAAREGGDTDTSSLSAARARFQSTPPVKAATQEAVVDAGLYEISIHAAREGGDAMFTLSVAAGFLFQSTPPVKAATSRMA